MRKNQQFNRVLLPEMGFLRPVGVHDEPERVIRDGSGLAFQVEELIAVGALDIVIEDWPAITGEFVKSLPPSIQKRISIVDSTKCRRQVDLLFAPIAEELGIVTDRGITMIHGRSQAEPINNAAAAVYFNLPPFLLGIDYRLQIDMNLQGMQDALQVLRSNLRSPDARAVAATLVGIFHTYELTLVDSLAIHSHAVPDLISRFEEFVQDETYRQLSRASHQLGIPDRIRHATTLVKRYVGELFRKPAVREIADLSSKGISMATKIPLPDSETGVRLTSTGYLPPIVSLRNALDKAYELWQKTQPDPIFPLEKP